MSITLENVLGWAAMGWHIFPLAPNSKIPAKGSHGCSDATTDRDTLMKWWNLCPDANWGVNAGLSGLLILDVDDYKPGCAEALAALDIEHGLPLTHMVKTPGGGTHRYYRGAGANTVEKLGKGLDTRGAGGYVVLPGSEIDGVPYRVVSNMAPMEAPEWLPRLVGKPAEAKPVDTTPVCELDSPNSVMTATQWLTHDAQPAVEGNGGDATTLRVCMRVKDLGISEPMALALLAQHYNPRCNPPWDLGDLQRKIANAFRYGRTSPGAASLEAAGFEPVEGHKPAEPMARTADTFDVSKLPARPWLLGHDLMSGFITGTIAQGGVGKSMIAMVEAVAISTGKSLSGVPVQRTGATWIYNTEDPMDELQRRIIALAQHYKLSRSDMHNVHVSSGRSNPLILGQSERGVVTVNEDMIKAVCQYITDNNILAWCVDPFVHTHYCEENSNSEMAIILQAFARIAEKTGVAINLVHHTSKGAGTSGDMDKARGASAFGGAVRIMRQAQTMSEDECGKWGIGATERKHYIGLYDAKGNMSPPADKMRWFRKVSVILPNTDNVGVVEPCVLDQIESEDLTDVREAVIARVQAGQYTDGGAQPLEEVAGDLKACEKDLGMKFGTKATLKRQIRDAFDGGALIVPGTLKRIRLVEKSGKCSLKVDDSGADWLAGKIDIDS